MGIGVQIYSVGSGRVRTCVCGGHDQHVFERDEKENREEDSSLSADEGAG